jgi:aspartyl aminopeptidase
MVSPPGWCALAEPLLRLPNLAIHMNREVNESGLKFNKQTELPLLLGVSHRMTATAEARFRQPIAAALQVAPEDLLTWELNAYDTQKGSFWGVDQRVHRQQPARQPRLLPCRAERPARY